ncbi:hypothetical protein V7S43_014650 [Phytophthora oleae]|uniref:Uncharacterized protein n=1 Tax=Phytophthora oleae TaxID=2107226 RepID=A0ABD3F4B2_9STRA
MIKFFFFFLLLLATAWAERNTLCDDGEPQDVTCHINPPETLNDYVCGRSGLLALQSGCYLCVDASTCVGLGSALTFDGEEQKNVLPLPKADGNDISVLLQDQADHSPEESAYEQAANPNLVTQRQNIHKVDVAKSPEVSNWLFSIPVCLAIVSLGLAIRARVPSRRRGFKRLQNQREQKNPLFQEDINPFCSNEDDENVAIETAGHFQGDPSNSESEEAQFLSPETEDDELTHAESEAIKQAVLLHIKEFDEEEAEI